LIPLFSLAASTPNSVSEPASPILPNSPSIASSTTSSVNSSSSEVFSPIPLVREDNSHPLTTRGLELSSLDFNPLCFSHMLNQSQPGQPSPTPLGMQLCKLNMMLLSRMALGPVLICLLLELPLAVNGFLGLRKILMGLPISIRLDLWPKVSIKGRGMTTMKPFPQLLNL